MTVRKIVARPKGRAVPLEKVHCLPERGGAVGMDGAVLTGARCDGHERLTIGVRLAGLAGRGRSTIMRASCSIVEKV